MTERYDNDVDSQSGDSDTGDSVISEVIREQQHPLYKEYMSRLGDADLCREEISDVVIEHEHLLGAKQTRQGLGIDLQAEDQRTLSSFPAEEARLSEELRRIEEDVERLRLECIREGILDASEGKGEGVGEGQVKDELDDETDILEPLQGTVDPEEAEYNKYSVLRQKPEEIEDEKKSKILLTGFKTGDTGDRITCWLLHKLRLSCLEVELLARFSEGQGPVDTEKWQEEVLEFWFVDSAHLPTAAYEATPAHTSFPHSPLTEQSKLARTNFEEAQFIHMIIRSSSLSQKLEFGLLLRLVR
jgi:hypothetical protein